MNKCKPSKNLLIMDMRDKEREKMVFEIIFIKSIISLREKFYNLLCILYIFVS